MAKEIISFKKGHHMPWVSERSRELSEKQRRLRVQADDKID